MSSDRTPNTSMVRHRIAVDDDKTPAETPKSLMREARDAARESRNASQACLRSQFELVQRFEVVELKVEKVSRLVRARAHPAVPWLIVASLIIGQVLWPLADRMLGW